MITDGILQAVQTMTDNFRMAEEVGAGNMILEMLANYEEEQWYNMTDEQKIKWIEFYIK